MQDQRSYPGLFVTFEGIDGCGKTTQAAKAQSALEDTGYAVMLTREPGGTQLGADIRKLILHGPADVDPRCEALLYAADRAYHVATKVRPALAVGQIVLQDRYLDSSVAYQGAGRQLGANEVRHLSEWATNGLKPDLTLLLDVDPQVAAERRQENADRLEAAGLGLQRAVRAEYLALAAGEPERFVVVDAARSESEIHREILGHLQALIEKHAVS